MKYLRKLSATTALTFALGVSAFAGCEPIPGQIGTPCDPGQPMAFGYVTPTEASTDPGDMGTPTLSKSDTSFAEIAADVLMSMLPLF